MATSRAARRDTNPQSHDVRIGEDDGRAVLLVEGVVQSIDPGISVVRGGYWAAMLPDQQPESVLILGMGGGTLAHLLAQQWGAPELRIVGVDDNPLVLRTAQEAGWMGGAAWDDAWGHLEVVEGDAFAYVRETTQRFDYVALDLYRGAQFDNRALNKTFLQQLRRIMDPPGWLVANLFSDLATDRRVERIGRVFSVQKRIRVGSNVVVHARGRRARLHED